MGVSSSTVFDDSLLAIEQPQVSISSPPRARIRDVIPGPVVGRDAGGKRDGLVYAICADNIFGRSFSSLDHRTNDMFWRLNTNFKPGLAPRHVLLGEDRFFDGIDDEDNEHEDFFDWNNDGDLPQDFNADDCENLVGMLDFANSLPSAR
jgi:hypothetical protein